MTDNSESTPTPSPRAAYAPPRLVVYGTLQDMTKAVGMSMNLDGGAGMNNRSQP